MFDYLPGEIGAIIHREPFTVRLLGKNFYLGHGDEVGYRPLKYRILQSIFRNRICQFLYVAIHPRWTFGFARRWSFSSRKSGLAAERLNKSKACNTKALEEFATSYLQTHPDIHFFIFGHLHLLADKALTPETRLLITGDWIQYFSYAEWDGEKLELKTILPVKTD
jgi:UDP-2,3-diacylglucosamine hydrolase